MRLAGIKVEFAYRELIFSGLEQEDPDSLGKSSIKLRVIKLSVSHSLSKI